MYSGGDREELGLAVWHFGNVKINRNNKNKTHSVTNLDSTSTVTSVVIVVIGSSSVRFVAVTTGGVESSVAPVLRKNEAQSALRNNHSLRLRLPQKE